jgi:ribose transport system substrate-binding protein
MGDDTRTVMSRRLFLTRTALTAVAAGPVLTAETAARPIGAVQPAGQASPAAGTPGAEASPAAGINITRPFTFVMKEPVKIGYSVYDMQQPYWQAYAKGIEDACNDADYDFFLSDQKSSEQTQVTGSLDLINRGISALIVSPVQPPALPAVVDAAHEAQIPVVIGDVGAAGDYDVFVLSDNYDGGRLAAQYMVQVLGSREGTKQVAMITLHPGSAVGEVRAAGWRDEITKHQGFEIVGELNGNDTVQEGFAAARDLLSANPVLAGIYCCNDPEALGSAQALKQAGKSGVEDVLLVGFNGDPPALELIQSGEIAATVRQDPYGQGRACVEAATALMNNQPVTVQDAEQRAIYFPVTVVDADNVGDYTG